MNENYRERLLFGKQLKQVRLSRHMTQSKLAALAGFGHPETICQIENGHRLVYQDEVANLARALRCRKSELLYTLDESASKYPLERTRIKTSVASKS